MGDDRGEQLTTVNVRKAVVAGKARRREPHNAADSRKILVMEGSRLMSFPIAAPEMICQAQEGTGENPEKHSDGQQHPSRQSENIECVRSAHN